MATLQRIILQYQEWFRLGLLHHEVLKEILLETFHKSFSTSPQALYCELDNGHRKKLDKLLKKGVIKQDQYDLIFTPGKSETNSSKFDVTLLALLIINCCKKIVNPLNGWKEPIAPTDQTSGANVIRARDWRNWHHHVDPNSIDSSLFTLKWNEGVNIAKSLGYIGDTSALLTASLDVGRTSVLESLVDWLKLDVVDLKKKVNDNKDNITNLWSKYHKIEKTCSDLGDHLRSSLSNNIAKINEIIEQLSEVIKMQDELRQYFTRLESVEAKVETIDKRVHIVEKTLAVQGLQSTVCDHFLDVPLNVPNFTGREDILKDIYSKLHEDNSDDLFTAVCLNGLGGVGKTSIAVRYAHLNRHNYESILWLQADDLHNSLQKMCEYFDISSNSQSKPAVMVQKLCCKIKKSKCLLVLDNAENFNSIDAVLKNLNLEKKPHVIVTSQQSDWSNLGLGQIATGVFTETEAIKFFDEVATDTNSVKKLVEELENLPLAMQLSLSYIKRHSMSVAKYLEAFCEEKSQLFHENTTNNKALLTVWKMAFEKLKLHEDRVSINILNMMAYMNNTFINMNTFLFYDKVLNEIMLNRVVDILCEYSLVTKRDTNLKSGQVVTMHKLIQRVLKEFEELSSVDSSLDSDHLSLFMGILKAVSTQQTNEFDIDNDNLWFIHMKHVFNNNEVQIGTLPEKFQTVAFQRGEEAIRHRYVVEYLTVNFNSENVDSPLDCVFVLANWIKEHCHFNEAFWILDEMIEGVHKEFTEVEKTSTMFLLFQMRCIALKYDSGHKKEAVEQFNKIKDYSYVEGNVDITVELTQIHAKLLSYNFYDVKTALKLLDGAIELCLSNSSEIYEKYLSLLMYKCKIFCGIQKFESCVVIIAELDDLFKEHGIPENHNLMFKLKEVKCIYFFYKQEFEEACKICLKLLEANFNYDLVSFAKRYLVKIYILEGKYKEAIAICETPIPDHIKEKCKTLPFEFFNEALDINCYKGLSFFCLNQLDDALYSLHNLYNDDISTKWLNENGVNLKDAIDVIEQLKKYQQKARRLHQSGGNREELQELLTKCQNIRRDTCAQYKALLLKFIW